MFSINMGILQGVKTEDLQQKVIKLAEHIEEHKALVHDVATNSLRAAQDGEAPPSSIEVLEDLRAILLEADIKGLNEKHKKQLDTIRDLCDQILSENPTERMTERRVPRDVRTKILSYLSPAEIEFARQVSTSWNRAAPQAQIFAINDGRLPLKDVLPGFSTKAVVEWLSKHPNRKDLEYADFTGFKYFDNECLDTLTKNCPNIKHLLIKECNINADCLKHLEKTPNLQSLDVSWCPRLEADCFRHLKHTPNLQSLNVSGCDPLEADCLRHLKHTPNLQSLDVSSCNQLEPDCLKHLGNTPNLQSLDVSWCHQLESDCLKHLGNTPNLQSLSVPWCRQLEADCLKYLEKTPNLQSLNVFECRQLEADCLKHLEKTPNLQSLDVSGCLQLDLTEIPPGSKLNVRR